MRFLLIVGFIFVFFKDYAVEDVKKQNTSKKIYYDGGRHITFLDQKFNECQEALKAFQAQKKDLKSILKILGSTLGECRNFQMLFSYHIKNDKKNQNVQFMKLIAAQNLFEVYLIYQILGLDKDEEAKLFARTLELKLMKILPTFRPTVLKN